jgi:hypothetical protein
MISPALLERGRLKWEQLAPPCIHGPLPFVQFDADEPGAIISFWEAADTGNEFDDLATGCFYAELLVHRAKTCRDSGALSIDPFLIIHEVLVAIAKQGNLGTIERGFLGRIAMLALAASLN